MGVQVHCFDCCACQTMNTEPIIPSNSGQSTRGGGVHFHCFDWCIFKQRTLSKWNNFLFKWMYFLIYRVLKAKYFGIFFHLRTKYWQSATSIIGCLFHSGSDNLMSSWFSLKLVPLEIIYPHIIFTSYLHFIVSYISSHVIIMCTFFNLNREL